MKISNLRRETRKDNKVYLVADVACDFCTIKELWFSVDDKYSDWLTDDVYDSFLVAAIWPCMCYHEDINIDGNVSKILFFHVKNYLLKTIKDFRQHYRIPNVWIKGFGNAKKSDLNIIGTGFSGGIDSFTTIFDRFENESDKEYRINTLFFFNIGQNGNIKDAHTATRAKARYELSKKFADSRGLPYVFLDSNLFEFYKPHWEYDAGALCRAASILIFQKVCKLYYVSSSFHYLQLSDFDEFHTVEQFAGAFVYYWLSTERTKIILDGGQYTRPEKTLHIKDYQPIRKFLNVCVRTDNGYVDTKNCSICHKCQRTLIILEALGIADEFNEVFDIPLYRKNAGQFIARQRLSYKKDPFIRENLKFAKEHGTKIPNYYIAFIKTILPRIFGKL